MRRASRKERGVTLIEVMITMAVLTIGLLGLMILVTHTAASNRHELIFSQSQLVAQRELERIVALGCSAGAPNPCANITALDAKVAGKNPYNVYWDNAGPMTVDVGQTAPTTGRTYSVQVDVSPSDQPSSRAVNIRVAVSWSDDRGQTYKAAALQTRMAP